MSFVYHRFKLSQKTINELKSLPDPFEGNDFGKVVFYRTYSRPIYQNDEIIKQEDWLDVVVRNINGIFSILKDYYIKNHLSWDESYWVSYSHDMCIKMYEKKWLPPGRGLWACGTQYMYEEGSMCLLNCGFIKIKDDIGEAICWMMDALMLGVGVGFEPIRNDDFQVYIPRGWFDHTVADSREGWVESTRLLIKAYTEPGQKEPRFNYEEIRPAFTPIKRFGGICMGPDSLRLLHDQIKYFFTRYHNWFKNRHDVNYGDYYDIVMLKTDLANTTGYCVVAGNVRRCIPNYVLLQTPHKMKKIEDIQEGDYVQTLNGYKRVLRKFVQGRQKLVSIWLNNNRQFKCTSNHKLAVLDSIKGDIIWKEAKDLKENDTLIINHNPLQGGKDISVLKAYFYGVLNGDGSVQDRRAEGCGATITFACSNNDIGRSIANKVSDYIHTLGLVTKDSQIKENNFKLRIYSTELALELLPYKRPHKRPIIPEEVYTSSIEARAAYLAGLCDADGNIKGFNLCSSKYILFLQEVQKIATSLGIDTVIRTRPERLQTLQNQPEAKIYSQENMLIVRGFASRQLACRLINPYMYKQFIKKDNAKFDAWIPIQFADEALQEGLITKTTYHNLTLESKSGNKKRNPIHKTLIDLYPDFWTKVIPVQVVSVDDYEDEEETYDIEVEDNHSFFADGLLIHNSAELCKGDIQDKVFLDLKQYENPRFAYRQLWGGLSNNSATLYEDEDFNHLGEVAERVKVRAEPGVINLRNFKYGRIGKKDKLRFDDADGINPYILHAA